ncbi:MAG: Rne/Rng family ribonuclease [Acidobacteria bacterium]|nr:Rne/Rng family ribonuclease [Acidobacteriota bacterium]
MSKEMILSTSPHETKVAMLEGGQVVEVYIEREKEIGLVGSIYKGRVTRVLPGMQSAFVDIGLERDAFLYVSDYFEDLEELTDTERLPLPEDTPVAELQEEPPTAAPPVEERQPEPEEEERQPAFLDSQPAYRPSEPALRLPETRPPDRGGHRRRHHRGGRNRHRHGRGRPDERRPAPRWQANRLPPPSDEPIILPGESLAKYRDRTPAPPVEPTPEAHGAEEKSFREPLAEPRATHESAHQRAASAAEETLPPAVAPEQTEEAFEARPEPLAAPVPQPELPREELSEPAAAAEEESGPSAEEEPASQGTAAGTAPGPTVEPRAEEEIEARELAAIGRINHERQGDLPPSVQERTAGGVEWTRSHEGRRGRPDRDRPRHRGGRGRGRHRDRDRGREERRFGRPRTHARPSRGQPPIAELLRAGQEVIVQIAKEQMGTKGARITSHITLPGRFLVFMPTIDHIGVSRKIATAEERSRLRRILLELKGRITGGFVVRTAATGCSEDDLREDIDYLVKLWHDIRTRAEEGSAPALLHTDLNVIERILRDQFTSEYESVWLDNEEDYARAAEFVARFQPALAGRLKLYTKPAPVFDEMGVQQEIDRALRPKVWLKSGGYIVINQTEALVAIDVNTGKFVGKGSSRLEDTIVKTNLEAVEELVRQIRLRDLGGIIIIDFIDMEDPRNRHRVMRALEDALRADRAPSKLLSFNEFGLVAITRKRSRQSLERVLCQPCMYCLGTGMVKSLSTLCYDIQGEARKMATQMDAPELTIRAHPDVAKALKTEQRALIRELEEQTGKQIVIQADNTLHFDQYNIY